MNRSFPRLLTPLIALLATFLLPVAAHAQDAKIRVAPAPHAQVAPATDWCHDLPLTISADRTYYEHGEDVRLLVRPRQDAYIFIYSTDGHGHTRQLFPNYFDRDNYVRGGETRRLPDYGYRLLATGEGWDTIQAIAVSAQSDWRPDRLHYRYSHDDPYPVVRGGLHDVRDNLRVSLEASLRTSVRRHSGPYTSIRVEVDYDRHPRPYYGEAFTQIYVHPRPVFRPLPPEPCLEPAFLRVSSSPNRSDVFIDGRFVGRTPLGIDLDPGVYDITIDRPGFRSFHERVRLRPGERERLSVRLRPEPRPVVYHEPPRYRSTVRYEFSYHSPRPPQYHAPYRPPTVDRPRDTNGRLEPVNRPIHKSHRPDDSNGRIKSYGHDGNDAH